MHSVETAAEETAAEARERERRAVARACERFLQGDGPVPPRRTLAELAEEAGEDEEADFYGEGELIASFEHEIAGLLGKEAAIFLPSGTMAQQIALRIWSERTGCDTFACHPTCHLEESEEKGYARLHGLHAKLVGNARTLITLEDLQQVREPIAALVLELPQRHLGGQLPAWEELTQQTAWTRTKHAYAHMDGARLWESAPFYDRAYAEIAVLFDSVYVSFYKGIGGLAGAALAGPADFIAEAGVWRRRHGGTLIHLYPYVLAARAGLRRKLHRFPHYHQRALAVAAALRDVPGVVVKPDPPQTHMMHLYLRGDRARMEEAGLAIARAEKALLLRRLSPTDLPDTWMFELAIGDGADAFSDEEIAAYFRRIVEAGA